jgi:REP element-mobilizing transposase RayT
MHIVLRSTQARGYGSFAREHNRIFVNRILAKHAKKCEVELTGTGNAGNHLHIRAQVKTRAQYYKFIRSITGEIAWRSKRLLKAYGIVNTKNFWDRRPFTSIVATNKYINRLTDYLKINQMEGNGFSRATARLAVKKWRSGEWQEFAPG